MLRSLRLSLTTHGVCWSEACKNRPASKARERNEGEAWSEIRRKVVADEKRNKKSCTDNFIRRSSGKRRQAPRD